MKPKNKEQCPICYSELIVISCAPCHDCGNFEHEIEHFKEGQHSYSIYKVYKGLELQLCNFCAVDFGAYRPEAFGFKDRTRIDYYDFEIVKLIEKPSLEKDKFCPQCKRRLKWLSFIAKIEEVMKEDN